MECSVKNGSTVIDLSPLIHRTGSYEAFDEDDMTNVVPDFYINICQPLNPIKDVNCPPGAAVCMVPLTGNPVVSPVVIPVQPLETEQNFKKRLWYGTGLKESGCYLNSFLKAKPPSKGMHIEQLFES